MDEMRLVIMSPVVPSGFQLAPPSVLPNRPFLATPTINRSANGSASTRPKFPHSEAMPASVPVTLTHLASGVVPTGSGIGGAPPDDEVPPSLAPACGSVTALPPVPLPAAFVEEPPAPLALALPLAALLFPPELPLPLLDGPVPALPAELESGLLSSPEPQPQVKTTSKA